jgi:hypothetical protein
MDAKTTADWCQAPQDWKRGAPCGIRSDDKDGLCVFCKAQGWSAEPT